MAEWRAKSSELGLDAASGETVTSASEYRTPESSKGDASFFNGQVLLGRFRIIRRIGHGGMGEVYEAEDLELGRVALKTVLPGYAANTGMLQRFRQEVQLARKVSGPQVCRIFELFLVPPQSDARASAFLTMEFLEGETLDAHLRKGALDAGTAQRIALDICAGLEAIHRSGVLHRDLKPRNIMLSRRDGEDSAILTDFGVALPLTRGVGQAEPEGLLVGTPQYMAPEQFEGRELSPAADIYALGVVLYEMVNGRRPFDGATPIAVVSQRSRKLRMANAPRGWQEIIAKCLENNPADRYQSASEVARALRRAGSSPLFAMDYGRLFARRHRTALAAIAAVLVAAAGWRTAVHLRQHVPPDDAVHWYGKGVEALEEATYTKAVHSFDMAVAHDPHFAMAHARLAEAWNELDFSGKAYQEMLLANREAGNQRMTEHDRRQLAATQAVLIRDFKEAEQQQTAMLRGENASGQAATLVDRGRTEQKDGDIPAALRDFQQAAQLAPEEPAAYVHIGILQVRHQHAKEAQAAFAQAEQIYDNEQNQEGIAEVEFQQGYAADDAGDVDAANKHLQRALDIARQIDSKYMEIRTLTQLSSVASYSTDQAKAIAFAQEAIDKANAAELPAWAAAGYAKLGNSYLIAGDNKVGGKAEQAYRQTLQIADSSEQPRMSAQANIGLANIYREDPSKASQYAQHAFDYYKQFGFGANTQLALNLLARALLANGDNASALRSADDLVRNAEQQSDRPVLFQAYWLRGSVLSGSERYPEALTQFNKALAVAPESSIPDTIVRLARVNLRLGRFSEAERLMGQLTSKNDGDLVDLRAEEFAERLQNKMLIDLVDSSDPAKVQDFIKLDEAVALARMGHFDKARAVLKQTHNKTPPDLAESSIVIAQIAWLDGRFQETLSSAKHAIAYYQPRSDEVSLLHASSLAALASARLKDHDASMGFYHLVVDTKAKLQQSWSSELYQSFAVRPDVQDFARQLDQISGAK